MRRQKRLLFLMIVIMLICSISTTNGFQTPIHPTSRITTSRVVVLLASTQNSTTTAVKDATTASTTTTTSRQQQQPQPQLLQQNRRYRKQPKKKKKRKPLQPWRAPYRISLKTQDQLKYASTQEGDATQRILETLLKKPEHCNVANLVCALTLISKQKASPPPPSSSSSEQQQQQQSQKFTTPVKQLLFEALRVLHTLVVEYNSLNARQYCNVLHALAKLYQRDPTLWPIVPPPTALSSNQVLGTAESWSFLVGTEDDDDDYDYDDAEDPFVSSQQQQQQQQLEETVSAMASRLADIVVLAQLPSSTTTNNNNTSTSTSTTTPQISQKQPPRSGELSMACWALATLHHRIRPAGWKLPPQLSHLQQPNDDADTTTQKNKNNNNNNNNFVTFEQWNLQESRLYDAGDDAFPQVNSQDEYKNWYITKEEDEDDDDDEEEEEVPAREEDPLDRFFQAVAQTAVPSHFSWKELANIAWSFSSIQHLPRTTDTEGFLKELAHEAVLRLQSFSSSTSSSSSVSVTTTTAAAAAAAARPKPRDLSQLTWSLGTLQHDELFRGLDDPVEALLYGIADYYDISSSSSFSEEEEEDAAAVAFHDWSPADLVQLGIAMAHGRMDHGPLLTALYQQATRRLKKKEGNFINNNNNNNNNSFQPWEVSALLWVQARLYLKHNDVYAAFAQAAPQWLLQQLDDYDDNNINNDNLSLEDIGIGAQEQANLAWSLTVLEEYRDEAQPLLKLIFQQASSQNNGNNNNNNLVQLEHAHQLWQALFVLEQDCPSVVEDVPAWFRSFLEEKWNLEKSRRKRSSARHKSLSQTLDWMGIAHYNEHEEDIDVAIVLKNKNGISCTGRQKNDREEEEEEEEESSSSNRPKEFNVAVEFDGPLHFTRPQYDAETGRLRQTPRTLGHTVLKYRLLKRQGWAVVRVPYYEFDKIPFWASMERQRYLQRLLKTHANLKFSDSDVSEYQALTTPFRKSRFD